MKPLRLLVVAGVMAFCTSQGLAATSPSASAEQASADLRAAIEALKNAESGKDRIAALTATIRAYEGGLSALRDALRAAAVREAEITKSFDERRDEIGQLLGVMTSMEKSPAPMLLLHPSGPLGTARSGMILSAVAPALQAQADVLRQQLTEVRNIRALQEETAVHAAKGPYSGTVRPHGSGSGHSRPYRLAETVSGRSRGTQIPARQCRDT
jgi:septal ring factor EnvC (AmiA/AmiB activator)